MFFFRPTVNGNCSCALALCGELGVGEAPVTLVIRQAHQPVGYHLVFSIALGRVAVTSLADAKGQTRDLDRHAAFVAPNGARVQVPKCDDDEELNAIAWSRPTSGTSIDAKLMRDGGSLTLSMSGEGILHRQPSQSYPWRFRQFHCHRSVENGIASRPFLLCRYHNRTPLWRRPNTDPRGCCVILGLLGGSSCTHTTSALER